MSPSLLECDLDSMHHLEIFWNLGEKYMQARNRSFDSANPQFVELKIKWKVNLINGLINIAKYIRHSLFSRSKLSQYLGKLPARNVQSLRIKLIKKLRDGFNKEWNVTHTFHEIHSHLSQSNLDQPVTARSGSLFAHRTITTIITSILK